MRVACLKSVLVVVPALLFSSSFSLLFFMMVLSISRLNHNLFADDLPLKSIQNLQKASYHKR